MMYSKLATQLATLPAMSSSFGAAEEWASYDVGMPYGPELSTLAQLLEDDQIETRSTRSAGPT